MSRLCDSCKGCDGTYKIDKHTTDCVRYIEEDRRVMWIDRIVRSWVGKHKPSK